MKDSEYKVVKRKIKNPRLEFRNGDLFVIIPEKGRFDPAAFVLRHKSWIDKKQALFARLGQTYQPHQLEKRTDQQLRMVVRQLISKGINFLKVEPRSVRYRKMKSRWGSCTSKGDITINTKLKFLPEVLIWYVVYHELCHLLASGHGAEFKTLMHKQFTNLKQHDTDLLGYSLLLK